MQKKVTEDRWQSTPLARKKLIILYDRIALERHDFSATRAERLQKDERWVRRLNADGPQKPLRQRSEFVGALELLLNMQGAHLAETEQTLIPIHPQHQQRQRQNQQLEGRENFDYFVDRKTGGATESHGESRRQHLHLHLQLRSGRLRNGKRVGAVPRDELSEDA